MAPEERRQVVQQLRAHQEAARRTEAGGEGTARRAAALHHHLRAASSAPEPQRAAQQLDTPHVDALPRLVLGPGDAAAGKARRTLAASDSSSSSFYWWDDARLGFTQAADACSSYGGSLAVLASASAGPPPAALARGVSRARGPGPVSGASSFAFGSQHTAGVPQLDSQVEYWIGLFNAAQAPGRNGSWAWVDLSVYRAADARWASRAQPVDGQWCAFLAWEPALDQWAWRSGDCSAKRAVLCSLRNPGEDGRRRDRSIERSTRWAQACQRR